MSDSTRSRISIAQLHVIEAEDHVARQRELMTELERHSRPKAATLARAILENLEKSLELSREHLQRVQEDFNDTSARGVRADT